MVGNWDLSLERRNRHGAQNFDHACIIMTRDVAVQTALNILGAAAVMEGLSEQERERLRTLAEVEPAFLVAARKAPAG
jgi:hypothetical protein